MLGDGDRNTTTLTLFGINGGYHFCEYIARRCIKKGLADLGSFVLAESWLW